MNSSSIIFQDQRATAEPGIARKWGTIYVNSWEISFSSLNRSIPGTLLRLDLDQEELQSWLNDRGLVAEKSLSDCPEAAGTPRKWRATAVVTRYTD